MYKLIKYASTMALVSTLAACAATPSVSEMTAVSKSEVMALLSGNTARAPREWGQWTKAYNGDMTAGNSSAVGSEFVESASFTSSVSEEGEICSIYTGPYDWSAPELEYCNKVMVDANGNYYTLVTKEPRKPKRVGKTSAFTIESGDPYKLIN